jgi:hypothetical protein
MIRIYYIAFFVIVFASCKTIGQSVAIQLSKDGWKGHLLIKVDSLNGKVHYYAADCFAKPVSTLRNEVKLRLIEELLKYEQDTMNCYKPVNKLSPLVTQLKKPVSDSFRIQVDALILINLIALGSDVFVYSPYPVLVLKGTGQEISDQKHISVVFAVYKKWLANLRANNFENYTPPNLSEVGIGWFGGAFENRLYKKPAEWSSYFDCIEL